MTTIASLSAVAALIGDPARAAMLVALMDGRALSAGELADVAGVSPSTASGHLGRMLDAGLLALERQGRHRYHRIAAPSVAELVEGLMSLTGELASVGGTSRRVSTGPSDRALRVARTCYDHLAGEAAVGMADAMLAHGQLEFGDGAGLLTEDGVVFLRSMGIELEPGSIPASRRGAFCRPCLDWSERRPHVAGVVGRAMLRRFMDGGWLRGAAAGRAVAITPAGRAAFERHFGLLLG